MTQSKAADPQAEESNDDDGWAWRMWGQETSANTQWPLGHGQLRDVKD